MNEFCLRFSSSRATAARRGALCSSRLPGLARVSLGLLLGIAATACGQDGRPDAEDGKNNSGVGGDKSSDNSGPASALDDFDPGGTSDGSWDGGVSGCVNPDGTMDDNGTGYDFSIIWIANSESGNGTVSKVDTREAVELARYRTGPRSDDTSPSRTSVSLRGDVAVANRGTGTVVKIAARIEDCMDANGDGMIQTSTGPNDVLDWGEDECVLWTHDLGFVHQTPQNGENVDYYVGGPRALAWEPGIDETDDPCALEARLWVGWRGWTGDGQDSNAPSVIRRIAADGTEDAEVIVESWPGGQWKHGLYGGAADVDGNFWGIGSEGVLLRVDGETLELDTWQRSGVPDNRRLYGIALDGQGNPWLSTYDEYGLVKFDIEDERFEEIGPANIPGAIPGGSPDGTLLRGLVVDRQYQVWIAGNNPCGIARYDIPNDRWLDGYASLPGCVEPVGVSIDEEEFVWVVDRGAELAYKIDRDSLAATTVTGFDQPYTYSDMTGSGLKLVNDKVDPPE